MAAATRGAIAALALSLLACAGPAGSSPSATSSTPGSVASSGGSPGATAAASSIGSPDGPTAGLIAISEGAGARWIVRAVRPNGDEQWRLDVQDQVIDLQWSPDGTWLAILAPSGLQLVAEDASDGVRLAGGQAVSWSPDSRRIAIGREGRILVYDLDRAAEEPIGPAWWLTDPRWSPDGTSILFQSDERPMSAGPIVGEPMFGLYQLSLADGAVARLLDPGYFRRPSWSPDGTRLAVMAGDYATFFTDAFLLDPVTGSQVLLGSGGWDRNPWSPDGERLFLDDSRTAWIASPDGTVLEQVAGMAPGTIFSALGWSPDGEWLLLKTQAESGTEPATLRALSADGERLVELGVGELADWQALGR